MQGVRHASAHAATFHEPSDSQQNFEWLIGVCGISDMFKHIQTCINTHTFLGYLLVLVTILTV